MKKSKSFRRNDLGHFGNFFILRALSLRYNVVGSNKKTHLLSSDCSVLCGIPHYFEVYWRRASDPLDCAPPKTGILGGGEIATFGGAVCILYSRTPHRLSKTLELAMRNDLTYIALIVDRSGSMASCKDEATGGINAFIAEQRRHPGQALFTLVQFDDKYEFVYRNINIKFVTEYILQPRGMTAYLDALGKTINSVGQELAAMPEAERPGCVVFVVVTDGQENASHEFKRAQIKEMVERQKKQYNWKFTFLGADESTFDEAESTGFDSDSVAKYSPASSAKAYLNVAANVCFARSCVAAGNSNVSLAFSNEQRTSMQ